MLQVESGITPVKVERNQEVKAEIRETLGTMEVGTAFVIEGKVKRSMVKAIAAVMNVKIKIAMGSDGKLRCWKL
jgi:hypothetical protein